MDMSPYDADEVARYQASALNDHAALLRFAFHVEKRDPANPWPQMVYARSAASIEERTYYLERAVEAGRRRLADHESGQGPAMDHKEAKLFRNAHYSLAVALAKQGETAAAARTIASLLEVDPADELNATGMGFTMGIFPTAASTAAARMTM